MYAVSVHVDRVHIVLCINIEKTSFGNNQPLRRGFANENDFIEKGFVELEKSLPTRRCPHHVEKVVIRQMAKFIILQITAFGFYSKCLQNRLCA